LGRREGKRDREKGRDREREKETEREREKREREKERERGINRLLCIFTNFLHSFTYVSDGPEKSVGAV
jgi:hypothetical protein